MNIFDIVVAKYPGIQRVSYFQKQLDGSEWGDPYDGLVWENEEIAKPSKEDLQAWEVDARVISKYQHSQNVIFNETIYAQLDVIDLKSIRALRTNDTQRLVSLEQEAIALRAQLLPES